MKQKPQNVYMPIDAFCGRVFGVAEGAERSAWVSKFALALAGNGDEEFARELLEKACADMASGRLRQARFRAARKKQKDLEVLVNPTLPGTACGDAAAVTNEGATAPAGTPFEARTPSAATTPVPASAFAVPEQGALLPEASTGRGGHISTPVPASAHGNAAVGGLLTPWIGPGTGESFDQGPDNGHRLPATTRADAHAREDWDASTTVRAQDFDGDAATREGAEAAASGFATSPSDIQRRPGKSATTSYERPIRNGGSERGAGGTAIDAVRRSPGAMKAERKLRYGGAGNVLMTATEMAKLAAEFGDVRQITEELSDYLLLHPGKYRSHYAALRNWCRRRVREGRNPDGTRMTQGDRLARHFAEREREILDGNVERE